MIHIHGSDNDLVLYSSTGMSVRQTSELSSNRHNILLIHGFDF